MDSKERFPGQLRHQQNHLSQFAAAAQASTQPCKRRKAEDILDDSKGSAWQEAQTRIKNREEMMKFRQHWKDSLEQRHHFLWRQGSFIPILSAFLKIQVELIKGTVVSPVSPNNFVFICIKGAILEGYFISNISVSHRFYLYE